MIDSPAPPIDAPRKGTSAMLGDDKPVPPVARRRGPDFVILIGCFLAMNALAIDAILPALALIQSDFGVASDNTRQWAIVVYLLALGVSQPFAGPVTDRFGRKPAILVCFAGYALISLMSQLASSFAMLIVFRFVHGLIGGSIRVIAISLIRDSYSGPEMVAKMSAATMVLMVAPLFAPALGQFVLTLGGSWRGIFLVIMFLAMAIMVWTVLRLPETLEMSKRVRLHPRSVAAGYHRVISSRQAVAWFVIHALSMASIFAYVTLSQQIYQDIYGVGAMFPIFFAAAGVPIIIASLFNIAFIHRLGVRRVAFCGATSFAVISLIHAIAGAGGSPPFWLFMLLVMAAFFCIGLLMPTSASLAMQPFERDVGYAAALLGLSTNCVGALAGAIIGASFSGAAVTMLWGHFALGAAGVAIIVYNTPGGRLFSSDLAS